MCGISGIIGLNAAPIDPGRLVEMTDRLQNRGPDGEGYLVTNNPNFTQAIKNSRQQALAVSLPHAQPLGFGHRRLSITDLSRAAAQPMTEATGRYWVVFNGQIYNHAALRKELEQQGYRFATDHSDTEVLLNSYSCWGVNCLQKFNGMWAFCIWDSVENTFFMARDRVGKQPFYYTVQQQQLYFASELNALLANKNIERRLDPFSVYNYLTYTNVPAPETMFCDIKKLPAAHYLLFKPGQNMEPQRYWNPGNVEQRHDLGEEQVLDEIRQRLFEATRLRMQADVSVGMLLSGGLDSSINLACMAQHSSAPIKAYTVGFENRQGYTNEFEYARKVAAYFKAELTEFEINEARFFEGLQQVSLLQDEPIADTANIPLYFIAQQAKKDNTKVLLSGEGSDELFIGYKHWRLIYGFEKIFRNKPMMAAAFEVLHKYSGLKNKRPYYQTWAYKIKNNWPVMWGGTEVKTEAQKRHILSHEFLAKVGDYTSLAPLQGLYDLLFKGKPYDTFKWMSVNDLQNRLPDQLLARLDRMVMAASVEGRNPFLDVNLVEFMLSVPPHMKVKNKTEKYLLKKAFEGILPQEIIYRPKDSFTVPLNNLFNDTRKKDYLALIETFNKDNGIFEASYVQSLARPENIKDFWNQLNLVLWYNNYK